MSKLITIEGEDKIIFRRVFAFIFAIFAIFSLGSIISYLCFWREDMSGEALSNMTGALGYGYARFLVCRCFGLASLGLSYVFSILAYRLFKEIKINLLPGILKTILGLTVFSLAGGFISYVFECDMLFGGGLGGDIGRFLSVNLISAIGSLVTGLVIGLLIIVFFILCSRRFAHYFSTIGTRKKASNETDATGTSSVENPNAQKGAQGNAENPNALKGTLSNAENPNAPENTLSAENPNSPKETLTVENSYTQEENSAANIGTSEETGGSNISEGNSSETNSSETNSNEGYPNEKNSAETSSTDTSSEDKKDFPTINIIEGQDLDTNVNEPLPRIDNRLDIQWGGLPNYKFFSLELLDSYERGQNTMTEEELNRNKNKICATLRNYKIEVAAITAQKGPTVTLYKVTPGQGITINQIKNRADDIAMSLNARGVRVVKLSDSVGIEVANDRASIVPLRALLNSEDYKKKSEKYELPVALGVTITQQIKIFDLASAPHLLVAGATQQGKSVCLNVIITSLLYGKHPSELKFVFIDPKMVEFSAYSSLIKHYLAVLPDAEDEESERKRSIVKNAKDAEKVLRSLCREMDDRYELLSNAGINKITLYNEKFKNRKLNPQNGHRYLPYLVAVVDEYADLTLASGGTPEEKSASRSITNSIIRLAQKGRAAGIHVILATQRPSVDVVSGIIKSNFPMRIAFRTASRQDSMTIIDVPGADKLIGRGDMLLNAGVECERVQCALIESEEVNKIADFIEDQVGYGKSYNTPYYLPEPPSDKSSSEESSISASDLDERFEEAARLVVSTQLASTSYLQTKMGMGFAKSSRVMSQLEGAGIVGPQDGAKKRQILVSDIDQLEEILNSL